PDNHFDAVISNSIIHHIPDPALVFSEMVRVTKPGGLLFVRDLMRPLIEPAVARLVKLHAAQATPYQQKLFGDSLRAALTEQEVRNMVGELGFGKETVRQSSDRHWTWIARKRIP
ncbi:MAG: class I SAM-dependent methyltransferase, partial [Gemmataceae bacterium]